MSLKYIAKRIADGILSFFYYDAPDDDEYSSDEKKPKTYDSADYRVLQSELSDLSAKYSKLEKKCIALAEYVANMNNSGISTSSDSNDLVHTQQLKDVLAAVFTDNQEKYFGLRDDIKLLQQRIDDIEKENNELKQTLYSNSSNSTINDFQPDVINTSQHENYEEVEEFINGMPVKQKIKTRLIKKDKLENIEGEYYNIHSEN